MKKEKERLSEEEKRTIRNYKANKMEYEQIKSLAQNLGVPVSRYVRERALGTKIYAPLSPADKEALGEIVDNRIDLLKFMNVFNGLSRSERLIFFRTEENMEEWIHIIDTMIDNLQIFLDKVYSKSRR